ncbi:MAG: diguanylate cyclase, partial [Pseudomonadota bacterium]|nr:diguanylate cyclase [Pseudomonadota bacterium]
MNLIDIITSLVKNISLRKKLLLVILTASNTALLLASMAVILYDRQSAKYTLQQEMKVLGSVMAQRSSAALAFNDRQLAEDTLYSLSNKSTVLNACIYDNNGELFATYTGKNLNYFCAQNMLQLESGFIADGYLDKQSIILDGVSIGSVYITTSLADINQRLVKFVGIVSLIFVAAGAISFVLAVKLQKIISVPIDELAEASR